MKNRFLIAFSLGLGLLMSVGLLRADQDRRHSQYGSSTRISVHESWGNRGGYRESYRENYREGYRHHRGGRDWSPWATAAVLGTTFYIANSIANPPVTTVVVPSPVVTYSPPRVAYFCQASQQYYPVVPTCTMPWQLVSY